MAQAYGRVLGGSSEGGRFHLGEVPLYINNDFCTRPRRARPDTVLTSTSSRAELSLEVVVYLSSG